MAARLSNWFEGLTNLEKFVVVSWPVAFLIALVFGIQGWYLY